MSAEPASSPAPGLLVIVNSLETGGAEKQVVMLLNHLDTRRFRLHLAYLKRNETLLPHLRAQRLEEVICCDVRRRLDRDAVRRLRAVIAARRIDALLCTNPYSMLYGYLARGARSGIPLITAFHSTQLHSMKEKLQMLLYRRLLNRCDRLIYVCDNQRQYWRRRGLNPPDEVIHNGIDVGFFTDTYSAQDKRVLRAHLGFGANDYVVGLCSALRPEKAATDLLHAVARLRARGLPAKALFIGDGRERARIEATADSSGMRAHMRITGLQPDVRPFVAACDVMTLVSRSVEAFSLAALEAMSLGKPMVLSDVGGASELVVPGEQGFIYRPGDLDALTGHLERLVDPVLREQLGRAAGQRVRERFTVEGMTERFAASLGSLLERRPLARGPGLAARGSG